MHYQFYIISPTAAAAISSGYLKDLIDAGHLPTDFAFLAVDRNKMVRARKTAMKEAIIIDEEKHQGDAIIGLSYDGRRDKKTRLCRPPNMSPQTLRVMWRRGDGRPLPSSSSPSFHSYSPHPDSHLLKLRRTPLAASMLGNYTCSLENGAEATVEVKNQRIQNIPFSKCQLCMRQLLLPG